MDGVLSFAPSNPGYTRVDELNSRSEVGVLDKESMRFKYAAPEAERSETVLAGNIIEYAEETGADP